MAGSKFEKKLIAKMERAYIFTGKVGEEETYQLLVNKRYILGSYNPRTDLQERASFYDEISTAFAKVILEEESALELGVMNGYRMNPETLKPEKIPKLEGKYVAQLGERVSANIENIVNSSQPTRLIVPVPNKN
jgi:hypothetical protein